MKITKPSLLAKITVTSLMLVTSTVSANESSAVDSLLELLFPTKTKIELKQCNEFPDDCKPKRLEDKEDTSTE